MLHEVFSWQMEGPFPWVVGADPDVCSWVNELVHLNSISPTADERDSWLAFWMADYDPSQLGHMGTFTPKAHGAATIALLHDAREGFLAARRARVREMGQELQRIGRRLPPQELANQLSLHCKNQLTHEHRARRRLGLWWAHTGGWCLVNCERHELLERTLRSLRFSVSRAATARLLRDPISYRWVRYLYNGGFNQPPVPLVGALHGS